MNGELRVFPFCEIQKIFIRFLAKARQQLVIVMGTVEYRLFFFSMLTSIVRNC